MTAPLQMASGLLDALVDPTATLWPRIDQDLAKWHDIANNIAGNAAGSMTWHSLILDTNVISELLRENPDASVKAWWDGQTLVELYTTSVVEAELLSGAYLLPAGRRRERLLEGIETFLTGFFDGRVLPFDRAAAREYATIMAHRRAIGRPMDGHELDCQIAAIARANDATVATRNVRDFTDCGIEIIDPWQTGGTS